MSITYGSMVNYVEKTAEKYPNHVALEFMGKKTRYSELCEKIDCAAKALWSIGARPNDIICVAMPNMPQAIIFIYAANKIGATVYMIHPLSSERELELFLNRVNAKFVLIVDQFYDKIEKVYKNTKLEHVIVASAGEALGLIKSAAYTVTKKKNKALISGAIKWKSFMKCGKGCNIDISNIINNAEPAVILNSGGTTGKVKGVCLSNDNINQSALQMIAANPMIDSNDRFLSVMPIFHGNGLVVGIHSMLMIGARCVLIPRFTPESYAKDLIRYKCNYMSGVPALFERLMQVKRMKSADLSFLKGVFSGADYLSVELERKINLFLKEHNSPVSIRQGYGMTEGVVATTLNPVNSREGSIGTALPGVEVKIFEPKTERELLSGEIGEIVFSSATNMIGYYNDPAETDIVLRKHSDGKTWIHSGDLGYADDDGFFYFKGRIKRMIVTNGYNVFPNELENTIEGFPMVDRCCVVGEANGEGTQKIKAFILLNNKFDKTEETKEKIKNLCYMSISKYAIPKEFVFIDEIPKTKVGKVDYKALMEQCQ